MSDLDVLRERAFAGLAQVGGGRAGEQLRLLPLAAGAWLGSGVGVGLPIAVAAWSATAAAVVAALNLRWARKRPTVLIALFCGGLAACLAASALQQQARVAGVAGDLIEQSATVTAQVVISGHPHRIAGDRFTGEPRWAVRVLAVEVEGRGLRGEAKTPLLVIAGGVWERVVLGERYEVRGRLKPSEPGDDIAALLTPTREVRIRPATGLAGIAAHVRARLRAACAGLPPDAAGLLPGLVVGDTSALSVDLDADMKATGLSHLTAVSGANITIVAGAVAYLIGRAGLRRKWRLPLAGLAVIVFVVIAGPEPSVLRAAVMGVVGLLGFSLSRSSIGVPALSASVAVLVFVDPWLSRAVGFALSVTATAGLLVLARPLSDRLGRWLPEWLALSIAVPLAAQVAVGPVTVLINPAVPLLAVPANMVVEPVIAPVTILGVVAALLAVVFVPIAQVVVWPAGLLLSWVAFIAHRFAAIPGTQLAWPQGWLGALWLALITVVGVAVLVWLLGRRSLPRPILTTWRVLVVAALVLAVVSFPRLRQAGAWPPMGWRVVACDVGQGSAYVVRTGPNAAVLVDAGPDPDLIDGCLRRLTITTLDLVVLTHFHADHVDGLAGALRHRTLGAVWTTSLAEPAERARAVEAELAGAGVTARVPVTRESGGVGEVRYEVLGPQRVGDEVGSGKAEEGSPANNASLVLSLRAGDLSVVSLGDAELAEQTELLASGSLRPTDVVLVAHHGSAKQVPRLYESIAPRVAMISVGADNDYGHPTPTAVNLMHRLGAVVMRTDHCGDAAVIDADSRPGQLNLQIACQSGQVD